MTGMRASAAVLALALLTASIGAFPAASFAQQSVPTPPSATSRVIWEHDGAGVEWFEVRIDGTAVSVASLGDRESGNVFAVPLPLLFPGTHQVVVAACNPSGCATSEPLVVRAVSAPIRWPKIRAGARQQPLNANRWASVRRHGAARPDLAPQLPLPPLSESDGAFAD